MIRISIMVISFILGTCLSLCQAQEGINDFSNYQEMRVYFGNLYQEKKFQEAAALLEKHLDRFPDHLRANAYNLAFVYSHLEQYQKGIHALQYALDRGIWFGIYAFGQDIWAHYKELEGFGDILTQNEQLRQEAQKLTKPDLIIVTPEGYKKGEKYPLFVALHGGGGNIAGFKEAWKSEKMEKEFITAYLQSSRIVAPNGFSWTEDIEIAKEEIVDAYTKIIKEYSIDTDAVIIGGFSSGGIAAMEVTLCHSIPVSGFIVLCPAKPESFTDDTILAAKERNVHGTILTTEMDPRLAEQKEMVEDLKRLEFQYQFVVTPNIGHWFPEDLDVKIDHAIDHIRYR